MSRITVHGDDGDVFYTFEASIQGGTLAPSLVQRISDYLQSAMVVHLRSHHGETMLVNSYGGSIYTHHLMLHHEGRDGQWDHHHEDGRTVLRTWAVFGRGAGDRPWVRLTSDPFFSPEEAEAFLQDTIRPAFAWNPSAEFEVQRLEREEATA